MIEKKDNDQVSVAIDDGIGELATWEVYTKYENKTTINLEEIRKFWPKGAPDINSVPKYINKYKQELIVIKWVEELGQILQQYHDMANITAGNVINKTEQGNDPYKKVQNDD